MFTEKHYLEQLPPAILDAYLARGWYRMGQSVFTCRFLMFDKNIYPAVWLRLPLAGYSFRKSLRKLYEKNNKTFRKVVRQAVIDEEKEALYQTYRQNFKGHISPTLSHSLLDETETNIFNTWEICLYQGDQLVAFSFFDLGATAMASILGVYDPGFNAYSLGFHTMLEEIAIALELGLSHYYPGYYVPGYSKFDYKLRIGEVECFDEKTERWLHLSEYPPERLPTRVMEDKLLALSKQLDQANIRNRLMYYPPYEANLLGYWLLEYLEFPLVLLFHTNGFDQLVPIAVYDPYKDLYRIHLCSAFDDLSHVFSRANDRTRGRFPLLNELMIKENTLLETPNVEEAALALLRGV